jgi:hypothetical protein
MSLTKLSLGGNNDVKYKLFSPKESLVSDIPSETGISKSFFYGAPRNPVKHAKHKQPYLNVQHVSWRGDFLLVEPVPTTAEKVWSSLLFLFHVQ